MPEPTWIFLYGADMNPAAIRADPALAGARFIDIGSVAAAAAPHLPPLDGRIHGILLTLNRAVAGQPVPIARRRGDAIAGIVLTHQAATTDRDAIVAEARYWELPVAWWRSLSAS